MPRLRPRAYELRGNAKFKSKKYKEAIKDYNESIKLDPKCVWTYFNRARTYTKIKRYKKAIKDYDTILKLTPDDDFAYYMRGDAKTRDGQYKEAIKDYNRAIKIDPYYFEAYCGRGAAECHAKQYGKALQTYRKAAKLRWPNDLAFKGIDMVYEQMAYDATERVRELLKQDNISIISVKVEPFYNSGIPVKKTLVIKKTVKPHKKDNYASLYHSKGKQKFKPRILSKEEKRKKIIDEYIKSLDLAYNKAAKYNETGDINFNFGKYKEAIKNYDKAIHLAPRMVEGYQKRGNAFFESGRFKEARKDFMRARKLARLQQKTKLLQSVEKNIKELDKVEASLKKKK
jgi:tetratricopeptide (TPR) repeat protein